MTKLSNCLRYTQGFTLSQIAIVSRLVAHHLIRTYNA